MERLSWIICVWGGIQCNQQAPYKCKMEAEERDLRDGSARRPYLDITDFERGSGS